MSPNTNSQMNESAFQMPATSPWTDWADKFASEADNGSSAPQQSDSKSDKGCSDALMDCYNG